MFIAVQNRAPIQWGGEMITRSCYWLPTMKFGAEAVFQLGYECPKSVCFFFLMFIYFERERKNERERTCRGGPEKERERESWAEPKPGVRGLTDWATQVPPSPQSLTLHTPDDRFYVSRTETNPTLDGDWASGILFCMDFIVFLYLKLGRAGANRSCQLPHLWVHHWHPVNTYSTQ